MHVPTMSNELESELADVAIALEVLCPPARCDARHLRHGTWACSPTRRTRLRSRSPLQVRDWPAEKGRKPFAEPTDETLRSEIISLTRQWRGQSIWAFWCSSRIVRYYLARWAQEEGARRP